MTPELTSPRDLNLSKNLHSWPEVLLEDHDLPLLVMDGGARISRKDASI